MSQPTGMIARSTDWPPQIVDVSEAKLSTASFRGEQVIYPSLVIISVIFYQN